MGHVKTITIPPGRIGVGFSSTSKPPTVTRVANDSPLKNKLKAGDVCLALLLKNGQEFSGLTTSELIKTLNRFATYQGRQLVVDVGQPEITVPLPHGKLGVAFKGNPPVVTKVADKSPMQGKIREGYVSKTLFVDNGAAYTGLNSRRLVEKLNETSYQDGRRLSMLKANPIVKIPLPAGTIGVFFRGSPPRVVRLSDDSPLAGRIKIGYVFHALHLGDGTKVTSASRGLKTSELIDKLIEHSDHEEGRILSLKMDIPQKLEVTLPAGMVGITIVDTYGLPIITNVSSSSPVKSSIRDGLVIDKITLEDGSEFCGYGADDIGDILRRNADSSGRILTLKDPARGGLSHPSAKLNHPRCVALPTGSLGVTFKGNDVPYVAEVSYTSPMRGAMSPCLYVDALIMPDGTEYTVGGTNGLGAMKLCQILKASEHTPGRAMMLTGRAVKRKVNRSIACEVDPSKVSDVMLDDISVGKFRQKPTPTMLVAQ